MFNFLKYKKFFSSSESSVSWNKKKTFGVSVFRNMRKAFFWENIRHFFGILVSWSIRNFLGVDLFYSLRSGWKVLGSISRNFFLGLFFWFFLVRLRFWIYKKKFPLRKYKNFFILEQESSISRVIGNFFWVAFFLFWGDELRECARWLLKSLFFLVFANIYEM